MAIQVRDANGNPIEVTTPIPDPQQQSSDASGTIINPAKEEQLPISRGQKTMAGSTSVTMASDQTAIPVSGTVTATPTGTQNVDVTGNTVGLATSANQTTELTRLGDVTETAPATDTASSGLNGRLQRIAQRLTSLIALLPGSLGQKARTASLAVTLSTEDVTALTPPAAITGFATASNQTDKSQFTKITDGVDTALVTTAGEQNVLATAQPGVDIGDVTINNATGASAVNIQDGGNSITVDGTIAATQSGTWTEANSAAIKTGVELIDDTVVAQGTALGTTKNSLIGGSVTTAAPTYITGQVSPLSLNTTGGVRVDGSGVTQPVSGTVTSTPSGTQTVAISQTGTNNDVDANITNASLPVTQSGTWTVQPGNTANTTAWKVDGSAVTQPVSGTVTANAGSGTFVTSDSATTSLDGKIPDLSGTWGYHAGTNGTLTMTGSKRVLSITAIALGAAGSFTINAGNTITIPYNSTDKASSSITIEPKGNLTSPEIIFDAGVDSYFVEYVV